MKTYLPVDDSTFMCCILIAGDCWLLAAVSSLCQYPNLLRKVIPPGQGFTPAEGYCGVFRFNFWVFGKWKEVIVDDYLPTKEGTTGVYAFAGE